MIGERRQTSYDSHNLRDHPRDNPGEPTLLSELFSPISWRLYPLKTPVLLSFGCPLVDSLSAKGNIPKQGDFYISLGPAITGWRGGGVGGLHSTRKRRWPPPTGAQVNTRGIRANITNKQTFIAMHKETKTEKKKYKPDKKVA